MQTVNFDVAVVRSFTTDLETRRSKCDTDEGMICSNLEMRIDYYKQLCEELRNFVKQWRKSIFTGKIEFDPEVESTLKDEIKSFLRSLKQVAALGRAMDGECFQLTGLDRLHYYIVEFDYLLDNWFSPKLSVSPAPRATFTEEAKRKISERLNNLPPRKVME